MNGNNNANFAGLVSVTLNRYIYISIFYHFGFYLFIFIKLTATTESQAAIARISAQETTPGQAASTLVLMSSIR